jgi:hypothetical protein
MVLNGAYLVDAGEVEAFTAQAARLVDELGPDLVVDCRGPWPPYSFAMLDQP